MRIPFPERILYSHALIFATSLCGLQLLEHTSIVFSAGCFAFILVATAAFNTAGGMPYASGTYILFNALFTLVLPLCVKVILGEPADSNLRAPVRSIQVYVVGMAVMLVVALVTRRFRAREAFIGRFFPLSDIRGAYIGSGVLGVLLFIVVAVLGNQQGSIGSFALQINRFPVLALLLGPIATIHATSGRRSMSVSNVLIIVLVCITGLLGFSKEALLTPFFCWVVAVAVMGFRLRWINLLLLVAGGYITVAYMIPYAQVGRNYENPGLSPVQMTLLVINHIDEVRETYAESADNLGNIHYYNSRIPLFDRLDVFSEDDALIDSTDRYGTFGFQPIFQSLQNFVPHFLWADKSAIGYGNVYAHEIGIIPDTDVTTGISFSPSADSYHQGRMTGLLVAQPIVLIIAFLVFDSIFGDVRLQPIGLMMTIIMVRISNEGLLTGIIIMLAQPLFSVVLAAFFCTYILPVVSGVFAKTAQSAQEPDAGLLPVTPEPVNTL